jgi:hypothetical protein
VQNFFALDWYLRWAGQHPPVGGSELESETYRGAARVVLRSSPSKAVKTEADEIEDRIRKTRETRRSRERRPGEIVKAGTRPRGKTQEDVSPQDKIRSKVEGEGT